MSTSLLLLALLPSLACSDYGFHKPGGGKLPDDDGGGSDGGDPGFIPNEGDGGDSGDPTVDEGDGGSADGGSADGGSADGGSGDGGGSADGGTADGGSADGGSADGGTDDACWEPEDGYTLNPASRLIVTDSSSPITVTFTYSDTSYSDELWMDAPESYFFFSAWTAVTGTTFTLGPYPAETELIFAVQVLDTGMHWQSGPAERNSDGVVHGGVTFEGDCTFSIGFEDLTGGGDLDYNDVVMRVQGPLRQDR